MPKDRRHYKPNQGYHPLRLKRIKQIADDLQEAHTTMLWTDLDDWTDAQHDIEAQVQGPPTYYNSPSTPETIKITNQPSKVVPKDQKEFLRDIFRAEFALRPPPIPQEPKRKPGRPVKYLHPKPKPPPQRPFIVATNPELAEMAKMYEKRIKATLKRRAKLKMKKRRTKADVQAEYDARHT